MPLEQGVHEDLVLGQGESNNRLSRRRESQGTDLSRPQCLQLVGWRSRTPLGSAGSWMRWWYWGLPAKWVRTHERPGMGLPQIDLASEWRGLCQAQHHGKKDSCHRCPSPALLVPTRASVPVARTKHGTRPAAVSALQLRGWNPGSGRWLGPFWKGLS